MNDNLKTYMTTITPGQVQAYKNLTMVPLLTCSPAQANYLLLDEALQAGLIDVGEVSTGGSVPELQVINKADRPVLILDGEELVGAKQNRIVNATILIAAMAKVIIPVSCVEQGRWSYASGKFSSQERLLCSDMRAEKAMQVNYSLKKQKSYSADQGEIWNSIDKKARRRNAASPSMAMSEIYEKDSVSLDDYLSNFARADNQAGAVFLINGKIAGLDSFAGPDTFGKVFAKLVKSYALDATDWYDPAAKTKECKGNGVGEFLAGLGTATAERRKSVAEGDDIRLESDSVIGFAFEHQGLILHLAAFAKPAGRKHDDAHSPMERHSARRRNRV